ncbi:MAG TPA: carboxylating nicotinate-nucleotide diphosphorylase [Myxococcales bacterium]|nr:carboxylating nicotinate-nucleotide diphosphorylase [Myxococcales bacterium]HIL02163.1 carboxylating nicotinate-nucleotide diphosphorylase [Myxococcales bacterium]
MPLTPPPLAAYQDLIDLALAEDVGPGDITSDLVIPAASEGSARIEARSDLTVSGLYVAADVIRAVNPEIRLTPEAHESETVQAGRILMRLNGSMRGILAAERTALNFLGRLCGVATLTRRYVQAVAHTRCQIVDTRKTLPGWRALDKFAVASGGGTNHRFALYDGILLKDNHVASAGGVEAAVTAALRGAPSGMRVQVEVESLEDAEKACQAGADFLLLDNQTPDQVRRITEHLGDRATLEASGGITLANLKEYAETGVHRISLGALTHSAPAADVALEIEASNTEPGTR